VVRRADDGDKYVNVDSFNRKSMTKAQGIVTTVSWKGHLKYIHIEPSGGRIAIPLSACVSKGDKVEIENGDAWVICKNGRAQFLRPYFSKHILCPDFLALEVAVKEITEADEHAAYQVLAEFHYRGHLIHGRTARLIIRSFHPGYPKVLGYIELATPFYMNKARATILDAPFESGSSVKWQKWDMATHRKYINVLVRIARVVVYPEFRGLGVGQLLVKHAAEFAKARWQVAGYMPHFIEISADMLKYIPFAERAGMIFVGETEGNLRRVAKDMKYLLSRFGKEKSGQTEFEEACGICDEQISRMQRVIKIMEKEHLSEGDLIKRLSRLTRETVLKDYALFYKVISLPKPHYMMGLEPVAHRFVQERVAEMAPHNGHTPPQIEVDPIKSPLIIDNITISYTSHVRRTKSTHAVQQAFGISPDGLNCTVIRGLTFKVYPGEIVLIVGPSGSGKTTLLKLIEGALQSNRCAHFEGSVCLPSNARIGTFRPVRSTKPLIEVLGARDVSYGLYLLGLAGLSEPFLYLKRFEELSAGQKYRAMLAHLLASKCNIWIADEFCANLDPITANVVSNNIQRIARKTGVTVIVAAPHCTHFLHSLKPDKVILLSSAWDHRVVSGKDYCRMIRKTGYTNGHFSALRMLPRFIDKVLRGQKRTTIRMGRKSVSPGLLLLESSTEAVLVRILGTKSRKVSQLTEEDAHNDGMTSLRELRATLSEIYPKLNDNSTVTIISFEPVCGIPVLDGYDRGGGHCVKR